MTAESLCVMFYTLKVLRCNHNSNKLCAFLFWLSFVFMLWHFWGRHFVMFILKGVIQIRFYLLIKKVKGLLVVTNH